MTALMAALAGGYFHLLNPNTHHAMGLSKEQPDKKNGWITMYESLLESVNYVYAVTSNFVVVSSFVLYQVCLLFLLCKLWSQLHHFRDSRGAVPNQMEVYWSRVLRR